MNISKREIGSITTTGTNPMPNNNDKRPDQTNRAWAHFQRQKCSSRGSVATAAPQLQPYSRRRCEREKGKGNEIEFSSPPRFSWRNRWEVGIYLTRKLWEMRTIPSRTIGRSLGLDDPDFAIFRTDDGAIVRLTIWWEVGLGLLLF